MGNGYSCWQVDDEYLYFKKLSGHHWGEFKKGRQLFTLQYEGTDNNGIWLRKPDGFMLLFTSKEVKIGLTRNEMRHLYNGSWVSKPDESYMYDKEEKSDSISTSYTLMRGGSKQGALIGDKINKDTCQ